MPEEINRILTDAISRWLFVSEQSGLANLRCEGIGDERIFFVGNIMIDTLIANQSRIEQSHILEKLGLNSRGYAVVTLHRPSNVDNPSVLQPLLQILTELSHEFPVVFPIHPRTRAALNKLPAGIKLIDPLGYLDFMKLVTGARLVLTDSGGIQEETTVLGVPCLTLRGSTERPITVEQGTNILVGSDPKHIAAAWREAIDHPKQGRVPQLWDGHAAVRIVDVLVK